MAKKLTDGFNKDFDNAEYHGDREYISSSGLKLILKNPREYYRKYVLNEQDNQNVAALSIGSYAHTRILEPHLVEKEYAIWTGGRRQGNAWKEFEEANKSLTILTDSQKSLVDSMVDKFNETNVVLGGHGKEREVPLNTFFSDGRAEETGCVEINKVKVKVRFDYRKEFPVQGFGSINDLKTTGIALNNATIEDVKEICDYWLYELSAALYVDVAEKLTGMPHDFYFCFLSKKDYAARIFKASQGMIERGRQQYLEAIELLKVARKSGIYYSNKIEELP